MKSNQVRKPNFLIICSDQQRADTLGCYGNDFTSTPNIDSLAANGVLFERAYCQNPVCTPSRSSFMTGRYPRTTRCRQNGQDIPTDEILFSKILSDNGYACGLSGKLHLAACDPTNTNRLSEKRIDDGFIVFEWAHDSSLRHPANSYHRWLANKGIEYEIKPFEHCKYIDIGMPEEYHLSSFCTEKAIDFIKVASKFDSPWMFMINFFDPHAAFDPPYEYLEKYFPILDSLPLPNYIDGELEEKPSIQKLEHLEATNGRRKYSGKIRSYPAVEMKDLDHRYIKAAYYAMCDLIDKQVGRLLDFLAKSDLLDDTIIIYMSDHGELLGDHGMYYKGPFFYEPCINVPYIFSYPKKMQTGQRIRERIEIMSLAPTILDIAGIPIPSSMQARSIFPALSGKEKYKGSDIYCEYYNSLPWNTPHVQATMVMDDRYKLVVYHNYGEGELYDLFNDPNETKNLWNNLDYMEVKMKLLIKLTNKMAWTVDPLPDRVAAW